MDTKQDKRFSTNPLVTQGATIRFYASAPLVSSDGCVLGTLLVYDTKPRPCEDLKAKQLLVHLATLSMKMVHEQSTVEPTQREILVYDPSPTPEEWEGSEVDIDELEEWIYTTCKSSSFTIS